MSDAVAKIERLLIEADQLSDARARVLLKALATALVDLVGEGLQRVHEVGGSELARTLADDEVVGNLLVLCGMHPDPAAVRARRALERASAELREVGVVIEAVTGETTKVRVSVRDEGEMPDSGRVRAVVEAIVIARAPDIDMIEVELAGQPVESASFVTPPRLKVVG
ncbi:MAG TPA: hypothetical protein VIV11_16085 [Kofleriaceae bacterium]